MNESIVFPPISKYTPGRTNTDRWGNVYAGTRTSLVSTLIEMGGVVEGSNITFY